MKRLLIALLICHRAYAEPTTCPFLSEAKVKELTSVAVVAQKHGNPQSCAMFQTPEGKDYLLVASDSAGSYATFVAANPPSMFPVRKPLAGVGAEAVLLRGSADPKALRALIARGDKRTVILTPAYKSPITDDQLIAVARAAVTAP